MTDKWVVHIPTAGRVTHDFDRHIMEMSYRAVDDLRPFCANICMKQEDGSTRNVCWGYRSSVGSKMFQVFHQRRVLVDDPTATTLTAHGSDAEAAKPMGCFTSTVPVSHQLNEDSSPKQQFGVLHVQLYPYLY